MYSLKSNTFGVSQQAKVISRQVASKTNMKCRQSPKEQSTAVQPAIEEVVTGVAFKPFTASKDQLAHVEQAVKNNSVSLSRTGYEANCELAINEQINREYTNSYVYHQLYAFFDRDNVGLPNLATFFKKQSDEERQHAITLMEFQNRRGGKVALKPITVPEVTEYWSSSQKSDALIAMELSLSIERLNFMNLRSVQKAGEQADDPEFTDFIESNMLHEQIQDINEKALYVSQLRRIGNDGHGVWDWDSQLSA